MPPDINASVHKFLPNNGPAANIISSVLQATYRTRFLPADLVKMAVHRAIELERDLDIPVKSSIYREKLEVYAKELRPRFLHKINEMNRQGKKW